MKKIELIELLRERTGQSYSPGMLNSVLGRAFNQLLYSTFRSKLGSYDSYAKKFENLDVEKHPEGGYYFTKLPANIIQLPLVADGVRNITTQRGTSLLFAPMSEIQNEIQGSLEIDYLPDSSIPIGYMLSKTKDGEIIRYQDGKISDIEKVNLLLLVPIEDLEMDEDIKIPSGKDVELIDLAIQIITGTPPIDTVNDGNVKTR